jgi:hypothetical protein
MIYAGQATLLELEWLNGTDENWCGDSDGDDFCDESEPMAMSIMDLIIWPT